MHEAHKAAGTVSALLHFLPIGIEDAETEIVCSLLRGFHDQDLVGPYSEVPIGQSAPVHPRQRNRLANRIEDNEIVACTLHLAEPCTHPRIIPRSTRLSCFHTAARHPPGASCSVGASTGIGWESRGCAPR